MVLDSLPLSIPQLRAEKKFQQHFHAPTPAASPPQRPPLATLTPGSLLPPSTLWPPAGAAAARRSAVHACVGTHERDFGWGWTGVSG